MIYAKNLPNWERTLRCLCGIALIAIGWLEASSAVLTGLAVAIGAVMILTSLFGFCPACALVGRRRTDK